MPNDELLTPDQIATYLRDGVLVVNNLLSPNELRDAHVGLANTLMEEYDVNVHDLEGTGINLVNASSTNGAGGVLDIFYPGWKMKIATNETLFKMTCQLWKEAYYHSDEQFEEELADNANEKIDDISFRWHPFGAFDYNKGYMYVDRIGYRIPTKLAERIGKDLKSKESAEATIHRPVSSATAPTKKKSKKARPIQRCLTPHFDCCPEEYNNTTNKNKWRPIQCFVSLTDNLEPNTGGFEAVPGFHREFHSWVQNGRQSNGHSLQEMNNEELPQSQSSTHPQPCVGEYTHLSPSHDRDIMQRVQHIPVKAGSVVFWDNRIPHGNAYRNDACADDNNAIEESGDDVHPTSNALGQSGARAVVYCSFLPDVPVNRTFVQQQLEYWKGQRPPKVGDRWIRQDDVNECGSVGEIRTVRGSVVDQTQTQNLSEIGKRLIGLQEWL